MGEQSVCHVRWLGRLAYRKAWRLQQRLVQRRLEGSLPDQLLLLEHPPVYTHGPRDARGHFLAPPS